MDERSLKIIQAWWLTAKSGKIPSDEIAGAVYFGITDRPPPPEVQNIASAIELLDYFKVQETGSGFTAAERMEITHEIVNMHSAERMPSFGFMTLMTWLPNIALVLALAAVVFRDFSWVVLGVALLAKIENGFARWLARQDHPTTGFHFISGLLLLVASLILSLLHIFHIFVLY